jgi:hypothetical protein
LILSLVKLNSITISSLFNTYNQTCIKWTDRRSLESEPIRQVAKKGCFLLICVHLDLEIGTSYSRSLAGLSVINDDFDLFYR